MIVRLAQDNANHLAGDHASKSDPPYVYDLSL